jgi:formylglycine-generating enzyme required for sulfatase activity/tRNA A-37 threonylcarbamoyl transferase component Bud32
MAQDEKRVTCPSCAHEFTVKSDADLAHLICPHCEASISKQAVLDLSGAAEDIVPGFRLGQQVGNYTIEALLGSGGMAVVFRGRQLSLNRTIAIKILPKDLAKNKVFVQRFATEATVLANLNHPNIISVIDRGCEGETYFIVMEYVEGETLKDRLYREGKLAPDQVLQISEQVLAGLAYAHRRGVVHRDIKPGNIMINREEKVKIADFGLAHLAKSQGGADATLDRHTMGTLKYMAPEQLTSARNVDERTDIYSFGVCLYELITGNLPLGVFKMPTEVDSTLDVRWDDIIQHSLREDANNRFASVDEMARALHELATTPRITRAQREKEEDAAQRVRGVVSLTTCASCGHESAPTVRQCEKCGATLEDIFDECPSCKLGNRLDAERCPGCGADLAQHRSKLRMTAEAIQAKARQFVADRQFDSALPELKKLEGFRTREYASMKLSARTWIKRVSQRRERFLRQTYEAGQRMVAEGNTERALEFWSALPDDYEDIVARRKDLAERAEAAGIAMTAGNRFYDQGDVAQAVGEWEKAAAFRPRDSELHRRLRVARDKLGNLNLKRSYLKEASEEAGRGNFDEALVLCRKALDLDPSDESALRAAQEIEAKERASAERGRRELAQIGVREAPKVIKLPKVKPAAPLSERLYLRPILAVLAFLGVIALGLWFFLMYIPRTRAETAMRAENAYNEALALKEAGKPSDAITRCSLIAKDYPDTIYAEKANDLSAEMQKLNDDAQARCEEAEAITGKGNLDSLIAGFKKYQEILAGPPVTLVAERKKLAEQRLAEIRNTIARDEEELGAHDEKNGDWHAALGRYRMLAEKFGFHGDPIASKSAQAQKRLDDCGVQVQVGQKAFRASEWDVAYDAAVAALDLVPADPDARSLLASIAPKLQPPPGMVLVPPGKYIVGGGQGNPRQPVSLPFGFFMDIKEVTCGRFSEFLHATGRPPPPGWRKQQGDEEMPVANVTWSEAAAFAAWAGCTLPTEKEWECACRGPSGQLYPWGDTWAPDNAVLGFGPAPVGTAKGDRSPCGCMDMAGNVAEWTATSLESSTAVSSGPVQSVMPAKPQFYIVKGSSWAGMEEERPTRVVAVPLPKGVTNVQMLLSAVPQTPEWMVRYRSDIEMEYLGVVGTADDAYVLVRKWMPGLDYWPESRFRVTIGQEIGGVAAVTVEEGTKPRAREGPRPRMGQVPRPRAEEVLTPRRKVTLNFSTGCLAIKQEPKAWVDVRDPSGAIRRLLLVSSTAPRSAKFNECKDAPPAPEMTLERAASATTRMAGRENGRYINVGFRCAKALWPLTSSAEKPSKAPAK